MATVTAQVTPEQAIEEKKTAEVLFSGSLIEGLIAAATVILAIIGLVGGMPQLLISVTIIALGVALLSQGAAISARFENLLMETSQNRFTVAQLGIGTSAEALAGFGAVIVGILAILGLHPLILIPSAIILIAASWILSAGANARLNTLHVAKPEENPLIQEVTREAVLAVTAFQVLVGMVGITLGTLALIGFEPIVLSLVSILVVSGSILLSSTAIAGRMATLFRF